MITMVLGSGHIYDHDGGNRCCALPYDEYLAIEDKVLVDCDEECLPDVLYDLRLPDWPFETASVGRVLDTTGIGSEHFGTVFWKELMRVMRPGATMIAYRRSGRLGGQALKHGFEVTTSDKVVCITRPYLI